MILLNDLDKKQRSLLAIFIMMLILTIGTLDYISGWQLSLAIVYLFPVILASWFLGMKMGIIVAIISATIRFLVIKNEGLLQNISLILQNVSLRLIFFLIIAYLLSSLKRALLKEKNLARIDDLAGIANRRYFSEIAGRELNRVLRYKHPVSIIYIDLDNFKAINDSFGHSVGNALLRVVANTISDCIRTIDMVARLGGDEFAVLMPETNETGSQVIVKRIHDVLMDAMNKENWSITFSIGVVTFIYPPTSVDEMLKIADETMYIAKSEGKNRINFKVIDLANAQAKYVHHKK